MQQMKRTRIVMPRGLTGLKGESGKSALWPTPTSNLAFQQLFDGFLAAQFISYPVTPTCLASILRADTAELSAAARNIPAADRSLPHRNISIFVQCSPHADSNSIARALEALAHWSQFRVNGLRVANAIRLTFLAADDTIEFVKETALEAPSLALGAFSQFNDWDVRISVRWADANGTFYTRSQFIDGYDQSIDKTVANFQKTALRLARMIDSCPLPDALIHAVPNTATKNVFLDTLVQLTHEFHGFTLQEQTTKLSPMARENTKVPLEPSGVVVRICDKRLGSAGQVHESTFHGVLLCFCDQKERAVAFAKSSPTMRTQIGMNEMALGLHICAVQTIPLELNAIISLFGKRGKPGEPISPPNSRIWAHLPAVNPLDGPIMDHYDVYPCARKSILPKEPGLHSAFQSYFEVTAKTFTNIYATNTTNTTNTTDSPSTVDVSVVPTTIAESANDSPTLTEAQLLASIGFVNSTGTRRTSLGEAIVHLKKGYSTENHHMVRVLLAAAARIGPGSSIQEGLECAETSIINPSGPRTIDTETQSLAAIGKMVLLEKVKDRVALKRDLKNDGVEASTMRIKRLLATLGLDLGGPKFRVGDDNKPSTNKKWLNVISSAIRASSNSQLDACVEGSATAMEIVKIAHASIFGRHLVTNDRMDRGNGQDNGYADWHGVVLRAIGSVFHAIVELNRILPPPQLFIISTVNTEPSTGPDKRAGGGCKVHASVFKVTEDSLDVSSFDHMIGIEAPSVILCSFESECKVQVIAARRPV